MSKGDTGKGQILDLFVIYELVQIEHITRSMVFMLDILFDRTGFSRTTKFNIRINLYILL